MSQVLDLYHDGNSELGIAREVRVIHSYVNNINQQHNEANALLKVSGVCCGPKKVDLYAAEYIQAE